MAVNQLLFLLEDLLNELLVICAKVIDITTVFLLQISLSLHPGFQCFYFDRSDYFFARVRRLFNSFTCLKTASSSSLAERVRLLEFLGGREL